MRILRYDGVLLFDFTLLSTSFKIVFDASLIYAINDTHMEELVLYWIQYKNSLKYKIGCFWRFSYVYTIN